MNDEKSIVTHSFSMNDRFTGQRISFSRDFEDAGGVTWSEVLDDFLSYLSCCYGYDIKSKVKIDSSWFDLWQDDEEIKAGGSD